MKRLYKKILSPFLRVFVKYYFAKPRYFRYKKIRAIVLPDVFFPHFTFSTKILLNFLENKELKNKNFLELGCGTGIISVLAANNGANVLSSDISPKAIDNAKLNATKNNAEIRFALSDLFKNIPSQQFDTIIINPPYYPKNPLNIADQAWYCGANFEYFEKLFLSLPFYFNTKSEVLLILSEDCEIEYIKSIAAKNSLKFSLVLEKKKWGEINYIFQVIKK